MSTILTNNGATKIAAAISASTSVTLASIAIGDGNGSAVTPSSTQTGLVHEVYRQAINSLKQDPNYSNVMIAEITVPASVGPWTMREVGLVDSDGVFIAVGNTQTVEKPDPAGPSASTIVVRMAFAVASTSAVTITVDSSTVIATRSWVIDLLYPVGEVLITRRTGNPATWLGGTWVRYGEGRMPVFYDQSQSEFNALDKTGGSKTHVNTEPEMVPHSHFDGTGNGSLPGSTTGGGWAQIQQAGDGNGASTSTVGGGQPYSIMNPFIVLFAWRRTA